MASSNSFVNAPGKQSRPLPAITLVVDSTSPDYVSQRAQYEAMLAEAKTAGYKYKTSCSERVSYDEMGQEYFVHTYNYTIEGPVTIT